MRLSVFLVTSSLPNLVPASTFVADVGGGMAGAKAGFKTGLR